MEPKLTITVRRVTGGIAALDIRGELTRMAEVPLNASFAAAVSLGARAVILELSGLTYMNIMAAGLLVGLVARARGQGRRLMAVGLNDQHRCVFQVTGLEDGIRVFTSEAQAVESAERA